MLDRAIIDHASPTLARLKLGNLFNYPVNENFDTEYADLRALLAGKGVALSVLRKTRDKALVYVYRADELARALRNDGVRRLLKACGYARFDVVGALAYGSVICNEAADDEATAALEALAKAIG